MERNELLLAITRCPELGKARADSRHPCRRVVCAQGPDDYHVPEPWQGHIETAPLLFVSINPGYGDNQIFPLPSWGAVDTIDFFERRFDPDAEWVRYGAGRVHLRIYAANGKPTDDSGNFIYNDKLVPFWRAINDHAEAILGQDPVVGQDYALTMAVHCKSAEAKESKPAMRLCPQRWLPSIMELSPAKIVVLIGAPTRDKCSQMWKLAKRQSVQFGVQVGGRERAIVILPHPNSKRYGTLVGIRDHVNGEELERLRAVVAKS